MRRLQAEFSVGFDRIGHFSMSIVW